LLRSKQEASDEYVNETYDVVMDGRLRGKHVALLFVGQPDDDAFYTTNLRREQCRSLRLGTAETRCSSQAVRRRLSVAG